MTEHPEAAHAASELDDYSDALPEAGGFVVVVAVAIIAALAYGAWKAFA